MMIPADFGIPDPVNAGPSPDGLDTFAPETVESNDLEVANNVIDKIGIIPNAIKGLDEGLRSQNVDKLTQVSEATSKLTPLVNVTSIVLDAAKQAKVNQPLEKGVQKVVYHAGVDFAAGRVMSIAAVPYAASAAALLKTPTPSSIVAVLGLGVSYGGKLMAINQTANFVKNSYDKHVDSKK